MPDLYGTRQAAHQTRRGVTVLPNNNGADAKHFQLTFAPCPPKTLSNGLH